MQIIAHLLQSAAENIVPLVVLLGLLIFVHELGHFLVAKYFKVRVEVFSFGFGPKLLKFKRGDTTYALSAIPLGGYVKMFGDDPTATIETEQQKYSFTHKPVSQRIAVVLAGPIMNFLFAILIFAVIAILGEQSLSPQVGDVDQKTAAYEQGFRSGDEIVSIGGEAVTTWEDVQNKIQSNGDRTVAVVVKHGSEGQATLQVTPKLEENKNPISMDSMIGEVAGLSPNSKSSFIGISDLNSPAAKAGLKAGDHVVRVDGLPVTKWRELVDAVMVRKIGAGTKFEVERGLLDEKTADKPQTVTALVSGTFAGKSGEETLKAMGIEYPELYLAATGEGAPAAKAGLMPGDRIVSIDGTKVNSFEQIATIIRSYGDKIPKDTAASEGFLSNLLGKNEKAAPPLAVVFSREGVEKTASLVPLVKKRMDPTTGNEDRRYEIGISPLIVDANPAMVTLDYKNPVGVVGRGVEQTLKWSGLTALSFLKLFQGKVSPKNVGGFFSIGAMAKKSWQIGAPQFLHVMAIISINLFVLNLLPVPVLDGGHLVFYTIEAVKGAPLSMRKMEIAQQVGLVLLLGLMVFALFNDATRMFFN